MPTTRTRGLALALVVALTLGACGSDTDDSAESTTTAADDTATTAAESSDTSEATEADSDTDTTASGTANTDEVVAAAEALMATLSDDELASLQFEFGDASLASTWSNLPACGDSARPGIAYGDLSEDQLAAALAVSEAALSDEGYLEYTQIIAADDVLGADGGGRGGETTWDSDCYYLAFYGTPSDTDEWAIMFGGHHYARIMTYTGDVATITPAFTGVEPTSFEVDGETVEPLNDEVDGIFSIFTSLDYDQLSSAEIDGAFDDLLLGPGEDTFPDSEGVLGSDLSDDQKELVLTSVRTWIDDFDASIADDAMATVEAELDETSFAWAVSTDPSVQGAYARIDGPSAWIEVAIQSGVGGADVHYHSIYRNKTNDYGNAG